MWLLGGMHGCLGACVVDGGHVWLPGGMHGCWGACVVARGHVWLPGGMGGCQVGICGCWGHVWLPGGMHGCRGGMRGFQWACVGYDKIWSMSGQYTSYWNAFLLYLNIKVSISSCQFH